ncbi:mechanosensitive ion channel family protein [Clostridium grantii]|uniref:Small-conductance mechanosensitive channel n=1 Tax=Clostridium grantii DSM 8605 TaxID=1121316 RepID=A0A1M5UX31_9CLOT|nr:mechanosensitive ion channel domain-containing protein [Clostridium grantii]SHH67561.1 Small-conductance mechanosensitive channel [Clostridium grantii DSM 8605]
MKNFFLQAAADLSNVSILTKVIATLAILFFSNILIKFWNRNLDKSALKPSTIMKTKQNYSLVVKTITGVILLTIWYNSKDILTFLGLFSAGLAFALRDVVANFLGWTVINSKKVFKVGDRIKIEDNVGDVLKIDWFHTTILESKKEHSYYGQSTGRYIHIPNVKILTQDVVNENTTFPYTWNEIPFSLSSESDWKKSKEIIQEAADKILGNKVAEVTEALENASKEYPIYYTNLGHTIYTSMDKDTITLTLRFMCKSKNFRNIEHSIVEYYLQMTK